MPPSRPRHPDDITTEDTLIATLGDTRRAADLKQWQVATLMGVNHRTVSYIESGTAGTIACHTLTGYARAVGRQVRFAADGLVCTVETPHTALLAALAATAKPGLRDEYLITLLIHRLAASRVEEFGITAWGVAQRMGVSVGAVEEFEAKASCRRLATIQRYVRALGGALAVQLVPAGCEVAA